MNFAGFPRLTQALRDGLERGDHVGGQIHVSARGEPLLDAAFGDAGNGRPMEPGTSMAWMSSGKPLTAFCLAILASGGLLSPEDLVARHLPEFARGGKEKLKLWHLLTHTAGFRQADRLDPAMPWDGMVAAVCDTPMEEGWRPGEQAGYQTSSSWFALGEVVQRVGGRPLEQFMREELLLPSGMDSVSLSSPAGGGVEGRDGLLMNTARPPARPAAAELGPARERVRPGGGARGPIRELARFYEMLLAGGVAGGRRLVSESTLAEWLRPWRVGLRDDTFQHVIDFSLGWIINSNRHGMETVPYGYGRRAGDLTFGHSGVQSSCGFGDPDHGLAVAWVMNGMCGEIRHNARAREINTAIYLDLGL